MQPVLEIQCEPDAERVILAVSGEVDMATVGALREALDGAASEAREVWVDLTEVGFLDSTGLTALLNGHHLMRNGRGRLTIVCPGTGPVRRALEISGLHEVFNVVQNRSAA